MSSSSKFDLSSTVLEWTCDRKLPVETTNNFEFLIPNTVKETDRFIKIYELNAHDGMGSVPCVVLLGPNPNVPDHPTCCLSQHYFLYPNRAYVRTVLDICLAGLGESDIHKLNKFAIDLNESLSKALAEQKLLDPDLDKLVKGQLAKVTSIGGGRTHPVPL
jgi:hypothetical protein